MELNDKVAVITGGTGGIGQAMRRLKARAEEARGEIGRKL